MGVGLSKSVASLALSEVVLRVIGRPTVAELVQLLLALFDLSIDSSNIFSQFCRLILIWVRHALTARSFIWIVAPTINSSTEERAHRVSVEPLAGVDSCMGVELLINLTCSFHVDWIALPWHWCPWW